MADMKKVYDDLIIINLYHFHTAGLDTIFSHIYPRGAKGVKKPGRTKGSMMYYCGNI